MLSDVIIKTITFSKIPRRILLFYILENIFCVCFISKQQDSHLPFSVQSASTSRLLKSLCTYKTVQMSTNGAELS